MRKLPVAILFIAACATPLHAEGEPAKPVFRVAATHESLSRKLQVLNANDPMKALEKSEGTDPSKENVPKNLIESSDLISYRGVTTLVPKRAIIQIPEKYKDRINNHTPGNRVVGWLDFYAMNRGWITTVEITRAQAGGGDRLSEGLTDQLSKSRNMIVTVLASGPISYMPYRGEDGEEIPENGKEKGIK